MNEQKHEKNAQVDSASSVQVFLAARETRKPMQPQETVQLIPVYR